MKLSRGDHASFDGADVSVVGIHDETRVIVRDMIGQTFKVRVDRLTPARTPRPKPPRPKVV